MGQEKVILSPLIERARQQGLWLWCSYQDLWFSPDELEAENHQGRFRWEDTNWQLRDPQEHITALANRIRVAESSLVDFQRRVSQ